MKWIGKYAKVSIMAVLVIAFLAGCTWHPGEEEIQALEETKTAALAAEKTLADKKTERKDLEAKLEAKKAELAKVKAEKEKVLQKLEEEKATTEN